MSVVPAPTPYSASLMPLRHVHRLASTERSVRSNRQLGLVLAFVAGAINAGGFLAVRQYTSHMTGIVSSMADHVVLGAGDVVLAGLGALLSFVCGATTTSLIVNYARRRGWQSAFALPLVLEATLLLVFGIVGAQLTELPGLFVPAAVMLLCFIMGLQNAVITKISDAVIRTTHVTGLITDLGIELGRLVYWNRDPLLLPPVRRDGARIVLLASMLVAFFVGGVVGAAGFASFGYVATVPLALVLIALGVGPVIADVRRRRME